MNVEELPLHEDTYFFGYGIDINKPYNMANQIIKLKQEKQELIEYLKEKKKEYTELYNKSCDIIDFDRYESLNILCEEILSKIEEVEKC